MAHPLTPDKPLDPRSAPRLALLPGPLLGRPDKAFLQTLPPPPPLPVGPTELSPIALGAATFPPVEPATSAAATATTDPRSATSRSCDLLEAAYMRSTEIIEQAQHDARAIDTDARQRARERIRQAEKESERLIAEARLESERTRRQAEKLLSTLGDIRNQMVTDTTDAATAPRPPAPSNTPVERAAAEAGRLRRIAADQTAVVLDRARRQADTIRAAGQARHDDLVAAGHTQAADIVASAERQVEYLLASVRAEVDQVRSEHAEQARQEVLATRRRVEQRHDSFAHLWDRRDDEAFNPNSTLQDFFAGMEDRDATDVFRR